ncbi:C40 family peptidase [Nocardioides zeae]|nr:C40 family peptidase [Nocardioides zeae]
MHADVSVPARPGTPAHPHSPRHRAHGRARMTARTAGRTSTLRRAATAGGLALAAVASTAALSVGTAQPAEAYPAHWSSTQRAEYERQIEIRNYEVLKAARSLEGVKYRYGGTSPSTGFDCSGYVGYVYKKVGKTLPRTSSQMAESVGRISTKSARVGDLVFFYSGGRVYHVAIYAGDGYVWHAPGTGERVKLEKIWTTSVTFGRV